MNAKIADAMNHVDEEGARLLFFDLFLYRRTKGWKYISFSKLMMIACHAMLSVFQAFRVASCSSRTRLQDMEMLRLKKERKENTMDRYQAKLPDPD